MTKPVQETLLSVSSLSTWFASETTPVQAVKNISFDVKRGETLALVGESGSGKSVTALSIMRLLPDAAQITNGSIKLNGDELLALPEIAMRSVRGKRVAMIFQEPMLSLNPVMTVGAQISECLSLHQNLHGEAAHRKIIELLNAVGIHEPEQRLNEYPFQFSGGMKQRVMIAMALAGEPDLLIADEPTTALDVTTQAQILKLLKELQQKTGMAILFITHDLGIVSQMADRVAVMYGGEILELATCETFFSEPSHAYSKKLFMALPEAQKPVAQPAVTTEQPILKIDNLKVYFPIRKGLFKRTVGHVKAVDGISLEIKPGRTLALVGESGSGKTTAGRGILQLLPISGGQINFAGEDLAELNKNELRKKRKDIQIIFQDPYASLNPRMRIAEIIDEGMAALGVGKTKTARLQRIDELLTQVGLSSQHKYRYPHEFSGGQRQRIAIARALAVEPKLIICDEPTSALDVSVQAQILELLQSLQNRMGLTYLFITHNLSVVSYLAHEVAVLYQGKIVEHGTTQQVLKSPQHSYTRTLLASIPKIESSFLENYRHTHGIS